MRGFFSLSKVTAIELARQKIVFITGFVALFLILVSLLLASLSLDEKLRITVHIGFGAIQITQVFLAVFLGSTLLFKELERQTLFVLLARPISRGQLFWSKWLGVSILLLLFHGGLFCVHGFLIGDNINWLRFCWAHFVLYIETLCILSIAFGLSTFLRPSLVIGLVLSLWLSGHWQKELVYFAEKTKETFFLGFADLSYYLFPKFFVGVELRSVYFLSHETINSWGVLGLFHMILYGLLMLLLGSFIFDKRDLVSP
jgi:Cu-processing system permease protein